MNEGTAPAGTITMGRKRADGYLITFEERPTGYRAYHLRAPDGGSRERYPSCTTVLGRIHPKDALNDWYEARGAEGAVRIGRAGLLRGVEPEDAINVVREHGAGAAGASGLAMDRGKLVHSLLEAYARDETVPNPADYPAELHGYIRGVMRWVIDVDLQPTAVEQLVAHRELRYAGRFDVRGYVRGIDSIVDLKTRPKPRIYFSDAMQLTGYGLAEVDSGALAPTQLLGVAVTPDGSYAERTVPVELALAWGLGLGYHNVVDPLERAWRKGEERVVKAA